jgi:hypothetical protein
MASAGHAAFRHARLERGKGMHLFSSETLMHPLSPFPRSKYCTTCR